MDLSQISTEDLRAFRAGDLSSVSTEGLKMIRGSVPAPVAGNAESGGKLAGLWQGIKDPFIAGDQFLTHAATKFRLPEVEARNIDARIKTDEAQYQADRKAAGRGEGIDWMRMGGNIAATAPLMAVPGAGTIRGATAIGGLMGAAQPVTDGGDSYWKDKAMQTGLGAGSGAVGGAVTSGLAKVIAPKTAPAVKSLMDSGVDLTPGQIAGGISKNLEDKATSVPILGKMIDNARTKSIESFNKATYKKVLEPIGESLPDIKVGRDLGSYVNDVLSKKYDDVLAKMPTQMDSKFSQAAAQIGAKVPSLPESNAAQFKKIVDDTILRHLDAKASMTGEQMKTSVKELGRLGAKYRGSSVAGDQEMGALIREAQEAVKEAARRSNPKVAPDLDALDKSWAMFTRTRTAGAALGAEDGVFTPAQLLNAVKVGDKSGNKRAFFRGDALLQDWAESAKKVLPSKVPDSGTAGRIGMAGLATSGYLAPLTTAGTIAGGSALYSKPGQIAARALLTKRPAVAGSVADAVSQGLPIPLTAAFYGLLNSGNKN